MKPRYVMKAPSYASQAKTGIFNATLTGLALLALAACSSAPARDADVFYDVRPEIAAVTFGTDKVLKVQSVSVKGLQSGRPLVFEKATNPIQLQDARGHLWHVSPSDLIEAAIVTALSDASQDLVIGSSDTIDNEDYRLKLIVSKFHFTPGSQAYFAFDGVLKDKRGQIISTSQYEFNEPLNAGDYPSAVRALESAMEKAVAELATDIASAITGR